MASPSPSSPTDSNPPSAVPLPLPAPPPVVSSRRLPPPCWTPEETAALIDAYRDKWYSLGRTNLKATHWQEVADAVTDRCPNASPTSKTAVQCRHKMEKLRKRYRSEIQRLRSLPVPRSRSSSSWVHFKSMDSMEKGPSPPPKPDNPNHHREILDDNDEDDNDEDFDDDDLYEELRNAASSAGNTRSLDKLYRTGVAGGGFRIRIPTGVSVAQPGSGSKFFPNMKMNPNFNPNPSDSGSRGFTNGGSGTKFGKERVMLGKRERERERESERGRESERDAIGEMVNAIKVLRDGFVRMEQMKMEMAREIETMRMEMEMKRTEMILESQQKIVEAFAKAVSDKKKKKQQQQQHKENCNSISNNNTVASPSES